MKREKKRLETYDIKAKDGTVYSFASKEAYEYFRDFFKPLPNPNNEVRESHRLVFLDFSK